MKLSFYLSDWQTKKREGRKEGEKEKRKRGKKKERGREKEPNTTHLWMQIYKLLYCNIICIVKSS